MGISLYDHQVKALNEIHNGSIVKGGVGSGKSRLSIAYFYTRECGGSTQINGQGVYRPMQRPRNLFIITTVKKRDSKEWEKELSDFALGWATDLNGIQAHVDSWNNIQNYTEVKDAFFIFDEQRLVGSGAWVKAFYKIAKQNHWILLSATPGDNWMDYAPVFIANGYYKNISEFRNMHVVYSNFTRFPKIERYVETSRLYKIRDRVVVDMPYDRHTTRHVQYVMVEYDKELFDMASKKRWHPYEDRPIRDVSELFVVMRKIVNSDLSRLGGVLKKMEKHPKLIVFYNFNYELDLLRSIATTTGVEVREWNGQKHEEVPTGEKWVYLVQYTAGAEGWNCITTDSEIFYSLNYSYKINEQAKGRTDRLNTPFKDLYYYVMRSDSPIDQAIMRSLLWKKTFNEKGWAKDNLQGWEDAFSDLQRAA